MKVGLYVHASESLSVTPVLRALSTHSISASVYRIRESWPLLSEQAIRANFASISHVVLWGDSRLPPDGWCALIAGYIFASDRPCYVLAPKRLEVPAYLGDLVRLHDVSLLVSRLAGGMQAYEQGKRSEHAREELIAGGMALTQRTFLETVHSGDEHAVDNFLLLGYSPNLRDEAGLPALFLAVRSGNAALVRLLVEYGALVDEQAGDHGTSPLMEAAGTGQVEATRMLLDAGAAPDLTNSYGQSGVILAAGEGHAGTVRLLLERGARTDLVDHLGMTALKYAELFHHEETARELRAAAKRK
ncbi:MAG: ankyrin repeat domain-containing protein [Spirochaetaceae bacterium]